MGVWSVCMSAYWLKVSDLQKLQSCIYCLWATMWVVGMKPNSKLKFEWRFMLLKFKARNKHLLHSPSTMPHWKIFIWHRGGETGDWKRKTSYSCSWHFFFGFQTHITLLKSESCLLQVLFSEEAGNLSFFVLPSGPLSRAKESAKA